MWNEVLDNLVVVKRSGQRVSFDASKIAVAIRNAFCVIYDNEEGKNVHTVFKEVLTYINDNYKERKTINVEDIQDIIENKLSEMGYQEVFDAFRGKKLLRLIMEKLTEECGTLYFEADEDLVKKYKAIGAVDYGKNEVTEQTQFYYGLTA